MRSLDRVVERLDEVQRAHRWVSFPVAVVRKFGDDQAGNLAALIAYYGFLSLFPLLLVLVTVLGFVLRGNLALQHSILHSALSRLPVIGDQIQQQGVRSIAGSGLALGLGIAGTVWAGQGGVKAFENAMDSIWTVPRRARPNLLKSTVRALWMLGVLGAGTIGTATLSGGSAGASWPLKLVAGVASFSILFAIILVAFKILTAAELSWRDVLPGALVAAVAWTILQALGVYYVNHQLKGASQVYGMFAAVIGLLAWLYLGAQITLLAAEINVVHVQRLWPRSLMELGTQDRRARSKQAGEEESEKPVETRLTERRPA